MQGKSLAASHFSGEVCSGVDSPCARVISLHFFAFNFEMEISGGRGARCSTVDRKVPTFMVGALQFESRSSHYGASLRRADYMITEHLEEYIP